MANENQVPTATIETSKRGRIKLPEFLRSLGTTAYVSGATILLQFLDAAFTAFTTTGSLDLNWTNLLFTLKVALFTLIGDTVRRILKESVTVIKVTPSDKTVTLMDDESGTEIPTKPPPGGNEPPPNP